MKNTNLQIAKHPRFLFTALLILSLGLLVRLMPVWLNPGLRQFPVQGADAFYHMRRILIAVFHPGSLGPVDYYQGLSSAEPCLWPISYSYLHALFVWIFSLGKPAYEHTVWLAALTPPLWGTLTAGVLILLCLRWGKSAALAVGALYLILPRNIQLTSFGAVDHHAAEVFFLALASYGMLKTAEKPETKQWLGLSFAWVGLYAVWSGSTLYAGMLGLFALVWGWKNPQAWPAVAKSYLLGGILLLPLSSWTGQAWNLQISYSHTSLFQPLILILSGGVFLCLYFHKQGHPLRWLLSILTLILAAFVALQLLQGIDFLFGKGGGYTFIGEIAELQPMHLHKWPELISSLTLLCLFTPVFVWLSFKEGLKENAALPLLLGLFFLLSFILMLRAERFLYLSSLWAPPLLIWGFLKALNEYTLKTSYTYILSILFAVVCLFSVTPKVLAVLHSAELPHPEIQTLAEWLKEKTPKPQDVLLQNQMPAYSVLAPWDLGHFLVYTAQRAVVSNNFGLNAGLDQAFYLAKQEKQALQALEKFKTRYILLSIRPLLHAPSQKPEWLLKKPIEHAGQNFELSLPSPDFVQALYGRLYFEDGSQGLTNPRDAFQHLRLVYESNQKLPINLTPYPPQNPPYFMIYGDNYPQGFQPYQKQVASYKLFEIVSGAQINGKAHPHEKLVLKTMVQLNKRTFVYAQTTQADKNGQYHFTVPYGSSTDPIKTRTIEPYQLEGDKKSARLISVTEAQVLLGQKVNLL